MSKTTSKLDRAAVNKILRRLLWVGLFLVAVGVVVSAVEDKEEQLVQDVKVMIEPLPDGNKLIRDGDVLQKIENTFGYSFVGLPIGVADVERLERVLKEDPFILDAEVFIDAGRIVNIEIWQRHPILRVIDNNDLNYYLDENGVRMPLSQHFTPRVLTVTGNVPPHTPEFREVEGHPMNDVFALARMVLDHEFFRPLIEQIHLTNRREFILVPKIGKQKIVFGNLDRAADKLENLQYFYEEGMPYSGWRKYHTLNVKYADQVIGEK